jgi:hypothetical protein
MRARDDTASPASPHGGNNPVKIIPNHTIKEGGQVYDAEQEYDVDHDLGVFFVRNGWATSPEYEYPAPAATTHDLQPHSTKHTVTSTEG